MIKRIISCIVSTVIVLGATSRMTARLHAALP